MRLIATIPHLQVIKMISLHKILYSVAEFCIRNYDSYKQPRPCAQRSIIKNSTLKRSVIE